MRELVSGRETWQKGLPWQILLGKDDEIKKNMIFLEHWQN